MCHVRKESVSSRVIRDCLALVVSGKSICIVVCRKFYPLSQTVKSKSIFGASGRENSFQDLLLKPSVGMPAFLSAPMPRVALFLRDDCPH